MLTRKFGHVSKSNALHDNGLARAPRVDRVQGDRGWFMDFDFPIGAARLPAALVDDGHELLRQAPVEALHAGYPYPGAALIVRRAVLQGLRAHCGQTKKKQRRQPVRANSWVRGTRVRRDGAFGSSNITFGLLGSFCCAIHGTLF